MPKEYRTIREVAGPLMMISDVDDVKYDELGEIELPNGDTRRCKVLEVNGSNALVQLFESAAGINLAGSKVRFLGRSMELPVSPDMLSRVFDGVLANVRISKSPTACPFVSFVCFNKLRSNAKIP